MNQTNTSPEIKIPPSILRHLKKITVVYTDVDGTFVTDGCLLKNQTGFTLNNARAIYDLLIAGVDMVMISGREKENLKDTARLLGLQNYIANLGIEIVYGQGEKVITNYGMDVSDKTHLKARIEHSGVADFLFHHFPGKISFYEPWSDILRTHLLFVGELDFAQVSRLIGEHFPELRIIDNGLVAAYQNFSAPHTFHVVPKTVGKKAAVRIDKKERGLRTDNLIGIGDSLEDVSLAEEVALFFLLDERVAADQPNVIKVDNPDGEAFSRIITYLKTHQLISSAS